MKKKPRKCLRCKKELDEERSKSGYFLCKRCARMVERNSFYYSEYQISYVVSKRLSLEDKRKLSEISYF